MPAASDPAGRRRRADAERSVERILDAAMEAFAEAPDPSMGEIARRAGVARATVYAHFPAREALLDVVTERAIAEVVDVVAAAEPERGEPAEALRRIVAAAWRTLGRFHSLVAINTGERTAEELHARHGAVVDRLAPLIERGQATGAFRPGVPPAWHLAMLLAVIHAGVAEVRAGRVAEGDAEAAVVATVLGALAAP